MLVYSLYLWLSSVPQRRVQHLRTEQVSAFIGRKGPHEVNIGEKIIEKEARCSGLLYYSERYLKEMNTLDLFFLAETDFFYSISMQRLGLYNGQNYELNHQKKLPQFWISSRKPYF